MTSSSGVPYFLQTKARITYSPENFAEHYIGNLLVHVIVVPHNFGRIWPKIPYDICVEDQF